jgi:4-hydroxybutyrate CoA-transferase
MGGKSIIALPATAAKGTVSRIACELDRGSAVSTSRNDVHFIVTEYGAANLRGKSIHERAKALIAIAHPNFRESLTAQARAQGML